MTRHSAVHDRSLTAAPALLRLAHQLTGDPVTAQTLVVGVLSRLPTGHAHSAEGLDEQLTHALIRSLPRRQVAVTTPSALDRLDRRSRSATALAFGAGWDAEGIADALGTSPSRARTAVGTALAVAPQEVWERLLADRRWSIVVPPTLVDDVERHVAHRRAERRLRALGAAAVALTLAGVAVAAVRTALAPDPVPPTAREAGLLHWPARGGLIRDGSLLAAATRLWRAAPDGPAGRVYVLWAGHVGVGRLVVLQGRDAGGRPAVAVVADHDASFRRTVLRLDIVDRLTVPDPPLLAVPYDGNLNVAGLQTGPSQQVVQMLVRPGVDRVAQRSSSSAAIPPMVRPSFHDQRLEAGLSEPWLDVRGDQPTSIVRAWSRGRVVFTGGLVSFGAVVPVATAPTVVAPPPAWAGLPRGLTPPALADDAVWWAQVCRQPNPTVALVWVSPRPPAARLELVTCAGDTTRAQLLVDAPGGTMWADGVTLRKQAAIVVGVAARVVGAQRGGGGFVAVIGDTRVAAIVISGRRYPGRWVVVPATSVTSVRLLDAHGRALAL